MKPHELKKKRQDDLRLSQEELATALNVARRTIIRWEGGHVPIPKTADFAIEHLIMESQRPRKARQDSSRLTVRRRRSPLQSKNRPRGHNILIFVVADLFGYGVSRLGSASRQEYPQAARAPRLPASRGSRQTKLKTLDALAVRGR